MARLARIRVLPGWAPAQEAAPDAVVAADENPLGGMDLVATTTPVLGCLGLMLNDSEAERG